MNSSSSILIVEDEPFLRDIIQMSLLEHDVSVTLASNGSEAIESIERQRPALVLLDLLMPRVDGYAVLEYIRSRGYTFPVVVLSNLGDPLEQEKCMNLGAKDFIIKSNLDEDELWSKISVHLTPALSS